MPAQIGGQRGGAGIALLRLWRQALRNQIRQSNADVRVRTAQPRVCLGVIGGQFARQGAQVNTSVDGRADIYALGRLLSEALAGELPPDDAEASEWLRDSNPNISIGLADLVGKCLAPEPEDRYSSAAALAADLRRHLDDLPLAAVKNRSWVELWVKWRRRRPHALLVFLLAVAAVGAGALILTQLRKQFGQAEVALEEGRRLIAEHRYSEARSTLRQGLNLTSPLYTSRELTEQLEAELSVAETAYAARELHEFVETTRVICGADDLDPDKLRRMELHAQHFWSRRRRLADQHASPATPEVARQLRRDLLELAILSAWMQVKLADPERIEGVHRACLEILAEAEALAGPSCAIWYARQVHAAALGLEDFAKQAQAEAEAMPPRNAWEYAAAGQSLREAGKREEAHALFEAAIQQEPQSLWANFCLGRSAYELGLYADAVASFTACAALAPNSASCFENRGQALFQLGRNDQARRDFDRALSLDPFLGVAALSRARLSLREERWAEAADDFRKALSNGADPASANYGLAAALIGLGDTDAARESLQAALQIAPNRPEAEPIRQALDAAP